MRALVSRYAVELAVFTVALAFRLSVPLFGGGYTGFVGSDQAVYYSGAMALSFRNLPYLDFSFVHPPLTLLALQPAAWVGRLTDDHTGFVVGNVWFAVLGAVTAVVVVRIARTSGLATPAQLAGGMFYAVWMGSVGAEFSSRLEPLGNVLLALGVLLLAQARLAEPGTGRSAGLTWWAGAVLGLTVSVKIWWAAPVLFLFAWEWWRSRDVKVLGRLTGGAVVASVVLNLPFLLASRGEMWNYIVQAQLGRPRRHPDWWYRWGTMTGVRDSVPSVALARTAEFAVGLVLLACVVLALRQAVLREMAVLVSLQAALLWLTPSFFPSYVDYLAVAAALTVAGATAAVTAPDPPAEPDARGLRLLRVAVYGFVAVVACLGVSRLATGEPYVEPYAGRTDLVAAASAYPCVKSDLPVNLVAVDALSRSFEAGCGNRVDVRGDALAMGETGPKNIFARRALVAYLRGGDAVVLNAHALDTIGQEPGLRDYEIVATNGQLFLVAPPEE